MADDETRTEGDIVPLDVAIRNEIRREFRDARTRFGESFEVLCLERELGRHPR
jgi:hypothetical protein